MEFVDNNFTSSFGNFTSEKSSKKFSDDFGWKHKPLKNGELLINPDSETGDHFHFSKSNFELHATFNQGKNYVPIEKGLAAIVEWDTLNNCDNGIKRKEKLDYLKKLNLDFPKGKKFHYNDEFKDINFDENVTYGSTWSVNNDINSKKEDSFTVVDNFTKGPISDNIYNPNRGEETSNYWGSPEYNSIISKSSPSLMDFSKIEDPYITNAREADKLLEKLESDYYKNNFLPYEGYDAENHYMQGHIKSIKETLYQNSLKYNIR